MASGLTFNIFGHDVSASSTLHKVEGESSKATSKIGSHFKSLGRVIGTAFAAAGVITFFKGAFDEATEAQKVGKQTGAVLKSTGNAAHVSSKQVAELATAISNKAGIDDEAIQSGENMLLTFTNIRNEVGKGNDIFDQSTSIMADMSVALGQDMKSSAMQLGKALNDPIKGVSALQRVGVSFTDQQKKQIQTMVETGDTMGAQKVILRELNKEFAGSAEAQATPAEKAKVAWANLQEQIGTYLMPVIAALSNFITQKVVPAVSTAAAWVDKHREGFKQLGTTLVAIGKGFINNIVKPIVAHVVPAVKKIVGWIQEHKKGLGQLARFVGGALKTSINVIANVFKFWATQIRVAIRVVKAVVDAVRAAARGISAAAHAIAAAFRTAYDGIKNVFGNIIDFVAGLPGKIGRAAHGMWDGIADAFKGALNTIIGMWNGIEFTIPPIHINIPLAPDIDWGGVTIGVPDIPYLAGGGRVRAGMPVIVGEKRPELFVPDSNGRILPRVPMDNGAASAKAMEPLLREVRALRRDVQRLSGDVYLDQSKVGTVMGRSADRLGRGR